MTVQATAKRLAPFRRGMRYDRWESVFAAAMSKRTTAVFAAAPIVQSDIDGTQADILSFPRGAQIINHWYANFDGYQGGGTCYWTPEFDAAFTTGMRYIWYGGANYYFGYDYDNNRFELMFGGLAMTAAHVAVAGTRISLAWAGDCLNDLDGTNYLRISINDAHTFDQAAQPTASAVDDPIYVGSDGTDGGNCGLIEALMFLRRVPWDGAQGIDIWGDEIAAQAAPADIALTCGSWDTTMFLPTDSSPGALVTGTGEAWSMIHGANVITALDGFMTRGVAWQNWAMVGTPINSALLANAEKIFASGGYKFDADAANEGYSFQVDGGLTAGADYVVRVTLHEGGGAQARIRIYDVTNAQQMIFTADFDSAGGHTRTAPWSETFCFELATIARSGAVADCATFQIQVLEITGGGAGTTVYVHQVEVYENLVDNPSLEGVYAGVPPIPPGWTNVNLDAGDTQAEAVTIHSGVESIRFNVGATVGEGMFLVCPVNPYGFVGTGGWAYTNDGRLVWASGTGNQNSQASGANAYFILTNGATWNHQAGVWRENAGLATDSFYMEAWAATGTRFADDLYAVQLDDVSLTVTPASEANSAESGGIRVDGYDSLVQPVLNRLKRSSGSLEWATQPRHAPANLVAFVEDPANGAFFLLAWGDATNYFGFYSLAANTITLEFNDGGGVQAVNWACAGAWGADQEVTWKLEYRGHYMLLRFNGGIVAQINAPVAFAVIPNVIYYGSAVAGDSGDMVIKEA